MTPRALAPTYRLPIRHMARIASWHYGVTPAELVGPRKFRRLCLPRFAVALVSFELGYHLGVIGHALGRDHTSIIAGRKRAVEAYPRDAHFAALVDRLRDLAADFAKRGPDAWAEVLAAREAKAAPIDAPLPQEALPVAPPPKPEQRDDDADAFAPFPLPHGGFVAMMQFGSADLLRAIRREFPGRCAA